MKAIFTSCALICKTRLILRHSSGKSFHEENECTLSKLNELGRYACCGRASTTYEIRFWRQSSLTFHHQSLLFRVINPPCLIAYIKDGRLFFLAKIHFRNDDNTNRCGPNSSLNCGYKNYFSWPQFFRIMQLQASGLNP